MNKILILLFLIQSITFPQSGWNRQNNTIYIDLTNTFFTDSLHGVVVGWAGLILFTTDGGDTWQKTNSGTTNNLAFVTFINAQVGTIVGDGGLILRTEDGGETWIQQNSGVNINLESVSFYDENNGIAVGSTFVLRTTDGGKNWEILSTTNFSQPLHRVNYFDYNDIRIFGGFQYIHLYKSTDAGITWTTIGLYTYPTGGLRDAKFIDSNTGFTLIIDGQHHYYAYLSKTVNGGDTWSLAYRFDLNDRPWLESFNFVDTTCGFIVGTGGSIHKTTDGGINWSVQLAGSQQTYLSDVFVIDQRHAVIVGYGGLIYKTNTGGLNSSRENWSRISIDNSSDLMSTVSVNKDKWFCVGNHANRSRYDSENNFPCVMTSSDGGNIWSRNDIWAMYPYAIWINEGGLGSIVGVRSYPCCDAKMYNTYDDGLNWEEYLFDESLNEMSYRIARGIYYLDNMKKIIVAQYGRILYTLDGGVTWTKSDSVTAWDLYDLSFADDKVGYVVGNRGTILKSTDSGINWSIIPINTNYNLYGVYFTDPKIGTVVGQYGKIWKTTDGGVSWIEQQSGIYNHLFKVVYDLHNNGIIVGEFGTILRTNDGGENWIRQESGTSINLNDISIANSLAIAVGDYGTILRMTDTTLIVDTAQTNNNITVISPIGGESWQAGTSQQITWTDNLTGNVEIQLLKGGVFNSSITTSTVSDGSYTWNIPDSTVAGSDYKIKILSADDENVFAESSSNFRIINNKTIKIPDIYSLEQNYPNPFNPITTITYQIPEISFVTIKVYDNLGREIITLVNEKKLADSYEVQFDSHSVKGRNLTSGIYFYQLIAGDFSETKKMVLLK